ncbi:MAG: hypothetical protein ACYDGO_06360 [Smithellaceae bacterium]
MNEERLRKKKKKVSVLFFLSTNQKLDEICNRMNRSKSGLIRLITLEWMDRMIKKGKYLEKSFHMCLITNSSFSLSFPSVSNIQYVKVTDE